MAPPGRMERGCRREGGRAAPADADETGHAPAPGFRALRL